MSISRLEYLFKLYCNNNISVLEKQEFLNLVGLDENKQQLHLLIDKVIASYKGEVLLNSESADEILESIFFAIPNSQSLKPEVHQNVNKFKIIRTFWFRGLVAASICLLMLFAGYNWFHSRNSKRQLTNVDIKNTYDAKPGTDNAMLYLSNGKVLDLSSVDSSFTSQNEWISFRKGELTVNSNATASKHKTQWNSLITPFGGNYKITLPDGTIAWLNAGSSLRFPNQFDSHKRVVETKGEIYFEVHHEPNRPFLVVLPEKKIAGKELEIEVLGTHFNVSAYADETKIQTTLLEGSVKVISGNKAKFLKPGQQATVNLTENSKEIVVNSVNTSQVIAWKEGMFEFNGNIQQIMKQISRWYNLDIEYRNNVGKKSFVGAISKRKNVSEVLKLLELTGDIHFELNGSKLIVSSEKLNHN